MNLESLQKDLTYYLEQALEAEDLQDAKDAVHEALDLLNELTAAIMDLRSALESAASDIQDALTAVDGQRR